MTTLITQCLSVAGSPRDNTNAAGEYENGSQVSITLWALKLFVLPVWCSN